MFYTPRCITADEIGEFRLRRGRRIRTNSLTGIIDIEEEDKTESKEEYKTKWKLLSPASEETKRIGQKKYTEQEVTVTPFGAKSSPFVKSSKTIRSPQGHLKMPVTDNKAGGTAEDGINRKEWNKLKSLVQKVATDL